MEIRHAIIYKYLKRDYLRWICEVNVGYVKSGTKVSKKLANRLNRSREAVQKRYVT